MRKRILHQLVLDGINPQPPNATKKDRVDLNAISQGRQDKIA